MKKHFDRVLLLYVLLGLLNYAFCNAVMLFFNLMFHLPETPSLILEFALQSVISFFLNRYVTFRGRKLSRLWPLYSLLVIAVCYLIAKVLLHGVFAALLALPALRAASEWLRELLRVGLSPEVFREKLVMLLCTFTYCVVNYFGQRYLVFRPVAEEPESKEETP